jgi:HAD superfamily hydrolase (TIGR01509 family)
LANRFSNIIWDVDGTLFDTYPGITGALHASLADLGNTAPAETISAFAKISLEHSFAHLSAQFSVDAQTLQEGFTRQYEAVTAADSPPFDGVVRVCTYIQSLSGKNVIVTHRGRAGTQELLEAHGMAGFFSGLISRDDALPRKPDPAAFVAALERFGLEAAETITVGDREIDIEAGQAAGIFSCLFAPVGTVETKADRVISSFHELFDFIQLKS